MDKNNRSIKEPRRKLALSGMTNVAPGLFLPLDALSDAAALKKAQEERVPPPSPEKEPEPTPLPPPPEDDPQPDYREISRLWRENFIIMVDAFQDAQKKYAALFENYLALCNKFAGPTEKEGGK